MLQVNLIKQNPEEVKKKLAVKNFKELALVDEIISLDEERKKLQRNVEDAQMQVNLRSAEIPKFFKDGKKTEADKSRDEVLLLKTKLNKDKSDLG